jgi:hypothetical protein
VFCCCSLGSPASTPVLIKSQQHAGQEVLICVGTILFKPSYSRISQGLLETGPAEEVQRAADLLRDYQGALAHESQALGATLTALRLLLVNQVHAHVIPSWCCPEHPQ